MPMPIPTRQCLFCWKKSLVHHLVLKCGDSISGHLVLQLVLTLVTLALSSLLLQVLTLVFFRHLV